MTPVSIEASITNAGRSGKRKVSVNNRFHCSGSEISSVSKRLPRAVEVEDERPEGAKT
jgi:hypothetical protein